MGQPKVKRDSAMILKVFLYRFLKDKTSWISICVLFGFVFLGIFAPFIAPYDPYEIHEGFYKLPPAWFEGGDIRFFLGTDDLGRDFLTRLIYGARISIFSGLAVVLFSLTGGILLGITSGYFRGWWDQVVMRLVDILMALPSLLLAIVIVAVLGPKLINGIIAVSLVSLPHFVRTIRSVVLDESVKDYIRASESLGVGHFSKMAHHIFPNCLGPIVVQGCLIFSDGILNVAALGFLGLGAQAPTPEWGVMVSDGRSYLGSASYLVNFPGLCILLVVLCFNIMGDGLRDALDVRLQNSSKKES